MGHCCLSLGFDSRPKDDELCHAATTSVHVPWNMTCLEIDDRVHGEIVNALMSFIGADPETATMEDLDDDQQQSIITSNGTAALTRNACITERYRSLHLNFTGGGIL